MRQVSEIGRTGGGQCHRFIGADVQHAADSKFVEHRSIPYQLARSLDIGRSSESPFEVLSR
jgi:hypothetical protein